MIKIRALSRKLLYAVFALGLVMPQKPSLRAATTFSQNWSQSAKEHSTGLGGVAFNALCITGGPGLGASVTGIRATTVCNPDATTTYATYTFTFNAQGQITQTIAGPDTAMITAAQIACVTAPPNSVQGAGGTFTMTSSLDGSEEMEWSVNVQNGGNTYDIPIEWNGSDVRSMAVDNAGFLYVTGHSHDWTSATIGGIYVSTSVGMAAKYAVNLMNPSITRVWERSFSTSGGGGGGNDIQVANGFVYIAVGNSPFSGPTPDPAISGPNSRNQAMEGLVLNAATGNVEIGHYGTAIGGDAYDERGFAVDVGANTVVVTGAFGQPGTPAAGQNDVGTFVYNRTTGVKIWENFHDGGLSQNDVGTSVAVDGANYFIAALANNGSAYQIIRLSDNGGSGTKIATAVPLTYADGSPKVDVTANSGVLFSAPSGLVLYDDLLGVIGQPVALSVTSVAIDSNDNVFAATGSGVVKYSADLVNGLAFQWYAPGGSLVGSYESAGSSPNLIFTASGNALSCLGDGATPAYLWVKTLNHTILDIEVMPKGDVAVLMYDFPTQTIYLAKHASTDGREMWKSTVNQTDIASLPNGARWHLRIDASGDLYVVFQDSDLSNQNLLLKYDELTGAGDGGYFHGATPARNIYDLVIASDGTLFTTGDITDECTAIDYETVRIDQAPALVANPAVTWSVPTATAHAEETEILVQWGAQSGATEYRIKRRMDSSSAYTWETTVSGGSSVSYNDTAVTGGITYHYVVSAVFPEGESNDSLETPAATAYTVVNRPASPTGFVVNPLDFDPLHARPTSAFRVYWTGIVGLRYQLERSVGYYHGQSPEPAWNTIYTSEPHVSGNGRIGSAVYFDEDIVADTFYRYRLTAIGEGGPSLPVTIINQKSLFPRHESVSDIVAIPGDAQVSISWSPSPSPEVDSYRIRREELGTSGGPQTIVTVPKNQLSFVDSGVANGGLYDYYVDAMRGAQDAVLYAGYRVSPESMTLEIQNLDSSAGTVTLSYSANSLFLPGEDITKSTIEFSINGGFWHAIPTPIPASNASQTMVLNMETLDPNNGIGDIQVRFRYHVVVEVDNYHTEENVHLSYLSDEVSYTVQDVPIAGVPASGDPLDRIESGTFDGPNGALQLPWIAETGFPSQWNGVGYINMHDYGTSGSMRQKVGAVTPDTIWEAGVDLTASSSIANVTINSGVYFAVGTNLVPVGVYDSVSSSTVAEGVQSARGYASFTAGGFDSSLLGQDIYLVIVGNASGSGIAGSGGALVGQTSADNAVVVSKKAIGNQVVNGTFDINADPLEAPWVRDPSGGYMKAVNGVGKFPLNSFAPSGGYHQALGTIKADTGYRLSAKVAAEILNSNDLNLVGEIYLAVGPNRDLVGVPIAISASQAVPRVPSASGQLEERHGYFYAEKGSAAVGQELYIVVEVNGTGVGWPGLNTVAEMELSIDDVQVDEVTTGLTAVDVAGDFSGANGAVVAPWYSGGGNPNQWNGVGYINLHDYSQYGWFYQKVGVVTPEVTWRAVIDLGAQSYVANVEAGSEIYFALGSGSTPVGSGDVVTATSPSEGVASKRAIASYTPIGFDSSDVGQDLYVVISGNVTGSGIAGSNGALIGQTSVDNMLVYTSNPEVSLIDRGGFDGPNGALQSPWFVGGGAVNQWISIDFTTMLGFINTFDWAQSGWFYQKVGEITPDRTWLAAADLTVDTRMSDVTSTSEMYFAVGASFTAVGNADAIADADPAVGEVKIRSVASYGPSAFTSAEVGQPLYLVFRGAATGSGIAGSSGALLGQTSVDNVLVFADDISPNQIANGEFNGTNGTIQLPWSGVGQNPNQWNGVGYLNLFNYETSAQIYQKVGTVHHGKTWKAAVDLSANSTFANVSNESRFYFAVGSSLTEVGTADSLASASPAVGFVTKRAQATFAPSSVHASEIGQDLYIVIDGNITGSGVAGSYPSLAGQTGADNVVVWTTNIDE